MPFNDKMKWKTKGKIFCFFFCVENSNGIIGEPDPVRPDRHFGNVAWSGNVSTSWLPPLPHPVPAFEIWRHLTAAMRGADAPAPLIYDRLLIIGPKWTNFSACLVFRTAQMCGAVQFRFFRVSNEWKWVKWAPDDGNFNEMFFYWN